MYREINTLYNLIDSYAFVKLDNLFLFKFIYMLICTIYHETERRLLPSVFPREEMSCN